MPRRKSLTYFVAVNDLEQPPEEQEGLLIEVPQKGGDNPSNREKALDIVSTMWEKGEIDANLFPNGLNAENIFYVPPDSPRLHKSDALNESLPIPPIIQGAQEIIHLTKLQLEVQETTEEAAPYVPIIEAVLSGNRPLNKSEREIARDKKYAKVITKLGEIVASESDYRENCTGNGKLILNAIAWQSQQKVDSNSDSPTQAVDESVSVDDRDF
ncbi:hypothetical protein [Crocosphaera sp. Alani8]|uniref:hypothetical protein n=1 Tax=Crocosphaera sp. Alani8 TaxID=3038952 RepID=UPI00313CA012